MGREILSSWMRGLIKAAPGGWMKRSLAWRGVCVCKEGQQLEKPPQIEESRFVVKPSNALYELATPCFSAEMFPELLGDSRSSWLFLALSLTA